MSKENWIKVEDATPEDGQAIVTYNTAYDFPYQARIYTAGEQFRIGVTHWMPLVPPGAEAKEGE